MRCVYISLSYLLFSVKINIFLTDIMKKEKKTYLLFSVINLPSNIPMFSIVPRALSHYKQIYQWELLLKLPMTALLDFNKDLDDFLVLGAHLDGRNDRGGIESCEDARQKPFVLRCDSYKAETSFCFTPLLICRIEC